MTSLVALEILAGATSRFRQRLAGGAIDVRQFLSEQTTASIPDSPERAVHTAFCARDGRVVSDAWVAPASLVATLALPLEHWLLLVESDVSPLLQDHLKAPLLLAGLQLRELPQWHWTYSADESTSDACLPLPGAQLLAHQGEVPTESGNQYKHWRMTSGRPVIHAANSGLFRPHDLNYQLLDTLDLTKGCFPGQEVVARTEYLGKPKSAAMLWSWGGSLTLPVEGDRLKDSEGRRHRVIMAQDSQPALLMMLSPLSALGQDILLPQSSVVLRAEPLPYQIQVGPKGANQ